ncbi:MAG TPA: sulfatase-like hydrolase/transferase [Chitinophagales bacterium]|nr:sulfatase-like hydrolase/transferase [Chitinophagales bacterium]
MKSLKLFTLLLFSISRLHAQQPNIIFIITDDMNDYVGVLGGHPQVHTPNIDSLAKRGVTFINAFSSAPGCAPSRTSMLSGKDCGYTKVYSNEGYQSHFRDNFSDVLGNSVVYTIPEILKDSGEYFTYGLGKIFHSPTENDYDKTGPTCEKEQSWNRMYAIKSAPGYDELTESYKYGGIFDFGKTPDSFEEMMDDRIAVDSAVAFINSYAAHTVNTCDRPFFLALGIHKPHTERFVPEHYFPQYYADDLLSDSFAIIYNNPPGATPFNGLVMPPQPDPMFDDFYQLPEGGIAQNFAANNDTYALLNDYVDDLPYLPEIGEGLTTEEKVAILEETMRANYVSAYIAAVQFADSMVGLVMEALYAHPELEENTIVVFASDHGYSLGEKRHWTKWTLWETDIRMPLIISHPDYPQNVVSKAVVSLLDLFPTFCDMTGVPYPTMPDGSPYLDGHSLVPLLMQPSMNFSNAALSSYRKSSGFGNCFPQYSVRTERFHYIRYQTNNANISGAGACDYTTPHYVEELYDIGSDRQTDPNEWHNIADDPNYAPVIDYMEEFIPGGTMYNQRPFTVNIYQAPMPCLLEFDDVLQMRGLLLNDNGELIDSTLGNYTFTWTNNLTEEIHIGYEYNFSLSSIPSDVFDDAKEIFIYLTVTETITGRTIAFKTKQNQLHGDAIPHLSYVVNIADHTIAVDDITLTGNYQTINWDFGDSYKSSGLIPGPHTFNTAGYHTIDVTIEYGNKCYLSDTRTFYIDSVIFKSTELFSDIKIFPNPASDVVIVSSDDINGKIQLRVFNAMGELVMSVSYKDALESIQLQVDHLPAGVYLLQMERNGHVKEEMIEVCRN